jgi:hypothetical protein
MLRPSLTTAAIVLLGASAMAQSELKSRLHPVTSEIKRAGVFNVATGTWTRNVSLANLSGPTKIYNNSCSGAYFGAQINNEKWQHRGRLPSPTGPSLDSVFYPGNVPAHQFDENTGCRQSYTINGFEFSYCSSKPSGAGLIDYRHQFASQYTSCGLEDMAVRADLLITGLPGGTSTGAQICWIVGIDLAAASSNFSLLADGNCVYDNGNIPANNTFGWSFGPVNGTVTAANATGPVIAGNFTWTGGPVQGLQTPCTGTDGTIWDAPVNLDERGTGMDSQNFFRVTGTNTAPSGSGCYYFLGTPHADFYLKLFSGTCTADPLQDFCFPGQAGVATCPCNNPPTSVGHGCNNFGAGPVESGEISAFGVPSIGTDTVKLVSTGENNTSTTIFASSLNVIPAGLQFGAGQRCVGNPIKRLYTGSASAGTITRPREGVDVNLHTRHQQVSDTLSPGSVRYYLAYYRDPSATGPCSGAALSFNCTNSGRMVWLP